jgi:hypothetical protein
MFSKKSITKLSAILARMPVSWNGRKAIIEMREAHYAHWKQMEWIGFYFQFLCEMHVESFMEIPGPRYGKVEFDAFLEIPWDFKVHPNKNVNGDENKKVILNDQLAITEAIGNFGGVGVILAVGEATYNDEDRTFQKWHQSLKGGLSNFEKDRIVRNAPSRMRKTKFRMKEIKLIFLNNKKIRELDSFQEGFRNSDGSSRNGKVLLDLDKISAERIIQF